jgi:hypothetical protein
MDGIPEEWQLDAETYSTSWNESCELLSKVVLHEMQWAQEHEKPDVWRGQHGGDEA